MKHYNPSHDYQSQRQRNGYGGYHTQDDADYEEQGEEGPHKGEINRFAEDAFRKSADAMGQAQVGETKKLFGLFNVDAGIAAWIQSTYNIGADFISNKVAPQTDKLVRKLAPKVGLVKDAHIGNAAAVAQIGAIAALKTGGYFGQIFEAHSAQRKQRENLAREIAPVLDDIKGNHSLSALYSVSQKDNEVIFSHRKRLAKIANTENVTRWMDLGVNAGPNMMLDGKRFHAIWQTKGNVSEAAMRAREEQLRLQREQQAAHGELGDAQQGKMILSSLLNVSFPQLAERMSRTSQYNLSKQLQPYSALEMILELNAQVASSPNARAFQEPKSFQSPHSHRAQYSLEQYLMRTFIQHQKDMADICPDHTEIREALREELAVAVKPIAAAIHKGDMNVMSLVRMVGEGKIIKKQGRGIASPDEVKALIKKDAPKQSTYVQVDPAEYYKDAAFTREQLKTALKTLEGDERYTFAAMFPDSVLAEAGMSKKEIHAMRDATLKHYDATLVDAIAGLNSKSDEALKQEGLAENEIQVIREAFSQIQETGVEAVKQLKTSATNENGIEHLLTNAVVHKPQHLGMLVNLGREANAGEMAEAAIARVKTDKHYTKNEDFSARELARRDEAQDVAAERF
jgi:hypothetical protein